MNALFYPIFYLLTGLCTGLIIFVAFTKRTSILAAIVYACVGAIGGLFGGWLISATAITAGGGLAGNIAFSACMALAFVIGYAMVTGIWRLITRKKNKPRY